jgi:hypothetical protein
LTRDELEDCLDNVEPGAIAGRIWDATEPYLGDRRLAHLRTVAEVKSPMRIYLLTYRATPLYTLLAVLSLLMCSWILAVVAIKLPSQHVRYLFSLVTLALTYLTGRVTPQPAFLSMVKFIGAIFLLSFQYLLPDYDTVISVVVSGIVGIVIIAQLIWRSRRVMAMVWIPHLVSILVSEHLLEPCSDDTLIRNLTQRASRLACLPIPDTHAVDWLIGSVQIAAAIIRLKARHKGFCVGSATRLPQARQAY